MCFCYQIFMCLVSFSSVFAFKKVIWTNNSLQLEKVRKVGFVWVLLCSGHVLYFFMFAANNPLSMYTHCSSCVSCTVLASKANYKIFFWSNIWIQSFQKFMFILVWGLIFIFLHIKKKNTYIRLFIL